jgi:hypothetical protein
MSNKQSASHWQVASDVLSSKIDDEVIIMGLQTDKYYGLDPVAGRIWELLEQPRSLDELVGLLLEEYEVDEATCRKETMEFLRDMAEKKLIREVA